MLINCRKSIIPPNDKGLYSNQVNVPGSESGALSQIRVIPGIIDVNLVFGQWDAIAVADAKALFELARTIVSDVCVVSRVFRTLLRLYKVSYSVPVNLCRKRTEVLLTTRQKQE